MASCLSPPVCPFSGRAYWSLFHLLLYWVTFLCLSPQIYVLEAWVPQAEHKVLQCHHLGSGFPSIFYRGFYHPWSLLSTFAYPQLHLWKLSFLFWDNCNFTCSGSINTLHQVSLGGDISHNTAVQCHKQVINTDGQDTERLPKYFDFHVPSLSFSLLASCFSPLALYSHCPRDLTESRILKDLPSLWQVG